MGLFSFLNKNKQDSAGAGYLSGDDDDAAIGAKARAKRASHAGEGAARRGKEAADPVLPEKKRARRRLVGAIALALAVAVGLPMILDSEPKPLATDIDIRIPAKDKTPQVPVPVAETLDRREQIVEPAKALSSPDVAEVKVGSVKAEAKTDPKPEPVKPEIVKTETVKADVKKVEPKVADKPAPKAAEPAKDTERALAILEGKPEAAAPSSQKYVVQVAALASQDKVNELQGKLKAAGIPSFTQKGSGELIRVRVGPFSKEEGAAIRAKLDKLGLSGSTVPNS
jgi:DedD protein